MFLHLRGVATWWRSQDSTRLFWGVLMALTGAHAVLVAYAALWVVWVGPWTGLDEESFALVPEPVRESAIGYSVAALVLFLAAVAAAGYRHNEAPGKLAFAATTTYCGFVAGYMWALFAMPGGVNLASDWFSIEAAARTPLLWPMVAAAAVVAWRLSRPRPRQAVLAGAF